MALELGRDWNRDLTKHHDPIPKPRLRAQFFFGLTLRDIAAMAGLFVAFLGFLGLWVTAFLGFFSWLVEQIHQ